MCNVNHGQICARPQKNGADQHKGSPLKRFARRFRDSEDGAIGVLTMFLIILFLMMGGLGIDTMRQEMERAKLQATLDAAVLAGAGAPDGIDPKVIVQDYFAKSNMTQYLDAFQNGDVVTTLNSTKVSARASMNVDTYLMGLSGVDTLSASGAATAEKRVPKLEIAMVLDVSGSMNSNNKIGHLKVAAKDFVTTIMNSSEPGSTVISVVPFSTSVTPSDGLYDQLKTVTTQDYSTCLYLESSDYTQPALPLVNDPTATPVKQSIYTSVYGDFDALDAYGSPRNWRSCYTDDYMRILPYSISTAQLHAKIDSFAANGNTSTDQGIKFASALLNPQFRQVASGLITAGEVDASVTNVPANFDEGDTMKVLIVMGDGQNTTTYFFDQAPSAYRGANSDLFLVTYQDQVFQYAYKKRNRDRISYSESKCSNSRWVCVYAATGPVKSVYYLKDPTPYYGRAYYNIQQGSWLSSSDFDNIATTLPGFISSERLSWEKAWGLISPYYYGNVTNDWGPWNDYVGSGYISGSTKNQRMRDICTTVKNQGVFVYTIGFEIAQGGTAERELQSCATSHAHYFRAEGVSITDAFGAIAGNVQHLRLTQ